MNPAQAPRDAKVATHVQRTVHDRQLRDGIIEVEVS